ncbi:hypothetical protein AGLY_011233 [Aphis glycines]|uniref:Uncharacterized protein n=1 Tax=Aphis glycines TaxID=307491 RepID=A0A6G0TF04_APHGL|nr:hypothetical protein AGLY_011233 [Aphis glycines]
MHAGLQHLLASLRRRYWICFRWKIKTATQLTGSLPAASVNPSPAFHFKYLLKAPGAGYLLRNINCFEILKRYIILVYESPVAKKRSVTASRTFGGIDTLRNQRCKNKSSDLLLNISKHSSTSSSSQESFSTDMFDSPGGRNILLSMDNEYAVPYGLLINSGIFKGGMGRGNCPGQHLFGGQFENTFKANLKRELITPVVAIGNIMSYPTLQDNQT